MFVVGGWHTVLSTSTPSPLFSFYANFVQYSEAALHYVVDLILRELNPYFRTDEPCPAVFINVGRSSLGSSFLNEEQGKSMTMFGDQRHLRIGAARFDNGPHSSPPGISKAAAVAHACSRRYAQVNRSERWLLFYLPYLYFASVKTMAAL